MVKKIEGAKDISEVPKTESRVVPTMMIVNEREIALDFSSKVYEKFKQSVKAFVYFGSSARQDSEPTSDIDLIILLDDVTINWDDELIATYREELAKIIESNPYRKNLHVNTVKLSTWWQDLMRGDPVVMNVLRYGEALIDYGGFFAPLKVLLEQGKIRPTPEAIYTLLERAPFHVMRARNALLGAVDGYYWACVDSAHAALIAGEVMPASPEKLADIMRERFVKNKLTKNYYVDFYDRIHAVAKDIVHGRKTDISGKELDEFKEKTDDFVKEMARLVDELVKDK